VTLSSAAFHEFNGYRYTITVMATGSKPHPVEAELWWSRADREHGRWFYFRRAAAEGAESAVQRVERDFKEWVDGQREATETE
jgi:hypothetical protein